MRKTLPAVPAEFDGLFLYGNTEFPVLSSLVFALSNRINQSAFPRTPRFIYRITSKVAPESVTEFAKPFQSGTSQITPSNAVDLLTLSYELGIPSAIAELTNFLGTNSLDLLIHALESQLSESADSSELEIALSKRLLNEFENPNLFRLPLSCLERIVRSVSLNSSESHTQLFQFCVAAFDHFGPGASVLFRVFDFGKLSAKEIEQLSNRPDFVWPFLGGSVHATLHSWNSSTLELLRSVQTELSDLRSQIEGLRLLTGFSFPAKEAGILSHLSSICRAAVLKEEANGSRVYDFGEYRIRPTHCAIETANPVSWVLEGSEDGSNWAEFDRRSGEKIGKFSLKSTAESRFLRLSVSGNSAVNFEVFGSLLDSPRPVTKRDVEWLRSALKADQDWSSPIAKSIDELRAAFETNRKASLNQLQGLLESSVKSHNQMTELSQELQGLSDRQAGLSNRVRALDAMQQQLSDGLGGQIAGQITAFCEQRQREREAWWAQHPPPHHHGGPHHGPHGHPHGPPPGGPPHGGPWHPPPPFF
jgi:hypothetical protein